ncbi:hypothetical protein ACIBP4_00105 [Micromonospora maritima]|uniref:Uncharacterized protein n=1 Tax=Micromonospora maritima TaxID=986711 RepID=A0ABW7ZCW8_9ACTN
MTRESQEADDTSDRPEQSPNTDQPASGRYSDTDPRSMSRGEDARSQRTGDKPTFAESIDLAVAGAAAGIDRGVASVADRIDRGVEWTADQIDRGVARGGQLLDSGSERDDRTIDDAVPAREAARTNLEGQSRERAEVEPGARQELTADPIIEAVEPGPGEREGQSDRLGEGTPNERLFVMGGKAEEGVPGPSRPRRDYDMESMDDVVGPYSPTSPQDRIPGRSMYIAPEKFLDRGMSGRIFEFKGQLPQGTAIHRDGSDVGGWTYDGHRTMYPTEPTTLKELDRKVLKRELWDYWGQVDQKGRLRSKDE